MTKLPSTVPCLAFEERDKDAFINDLTEEKEERDLLKEAYKIQKEKGWLTVSILQLRLKVNNETAKGLYQKVVS